VTGIAGVRLSERTKTQGAGPAGGIPVSDVVVIPVERGPEIDSRTAVVDVPADAIFARLVDPRRHRELDGSGSVRDGVSGPDRLRQGDRFTVGMRQFGIPYRITSTVTRLEDGREIEWRHPAGHTWRWELEPLDAGRTRVTETWDNTAGRVKLLYQVLGVARRNAAGIEATLRGLPSRVGGRP
jgi:hypothetical protein